MGFYYDRILPHLIALTMRNGNLAPSRERVISSADGRVLELGIGAGANLPFYPARVRDIIGLEPSPFTAARRDGAARVAWLARTRVFRRVAGREGSAR